MEPTFDNLREFINNPIGQFKFFNIPYTDQEKECIENFNIENNIMFYTPNLDNLEEYLSRIGSNHPENISSIANIIRKLKNLILPAYNTEYYMLYIKTHLPSDEFDKIRWHCDGTELPRFGTVFKGNGTLFLKTNTVEERNIYLQCREDYFEGRMPMDEKRDIFINNLKGEPYVLGKHQFALFFSQPLERCAIHSEPRIDSTRMFVSFIPMTKEYFDLHKHQFRQTGGFYSKYLKYKNKYLQLKNLTNIGKIRNQIN